ncbi:MAG: protein-L-isoaspartate(D-aspartate) O-methyltransferase [candidate division WOR-3 bacterium]|nr:protein-L-isoaspartate(D-aspartate) O-methyltransferase [candidate division WOR-3 bacterium]MCX7837411.1 protein-L-isoaspartate(D-aspartate) O-methyltransferase [candidate division WOR-3 bacterium]MDW8113801.1 protein-L-isoaspartate(D-aspartate) O-methyltransferase [candidate division WOR-3 bacterium]
MKKLLKLFFIILFLLFCPKMKKENSEEYYKSLRERMVKEQIEARGIKDQRVLKAMREVKRHLFVPEAFRNESYNDYPLPIGEGQTISQPFIVALMTYLLEPETTDKVLEIGTGSGYQAAVLSLLVKEVYTIEIIEKLAKDAEKRLKELGYHNVKVKWGDGFEGWEEYAPFDKIIITCALPYIPKPLKDQLKEGGKIIAPIEKNGIQVLSLFVKKGDKLIEKVYDYVRFVPMRGKIEIEQERK